MVKLVNRAKMTTATTGTGTITLGSAVDGFQTFDAAGVANADVVRYVIEDGTAWEIGTGTYSSAGGTLTRTPSESSIGGGAIALSGSASVFATAAGQDILQPGDNISELTNDTGFTTNTGTVTSVAVSSGSGISVSGSPITTSGAITVTNDAPMVFPASGIAVSTGSAWDTSLTAPSGALVGTTDTQTLTNKTLTTPTLTGAPFVDGSYRGNVVAVAALDIDCSAGNYFTKSISANSTFTFSNVPASRAYAFTLAVTVSGDRAITWPASVEFPGDEAPTLTAGKTHLFMFATDNGGTTFRGAALADYEA